MAYKTLEKSFYADASIERFSNHQSLYRNRLESPSTIRTGIELSSGELFCALPVSLALKGEAIYKNEPSIAGLWAGLPHVAQGALIRSLVLDEVVCSNEIEGVHSTRRQVEVALEKANSRNGGHAPFFEFAKLYLSLCDSPELPSSPAQVRAVFDAVVDGSLAPDAKPDGELFRAGPVHVEDNRGKRIHNGVQQEDKINALIQQMLELCRREDIPSLYSAILGHFLFEYIHPFYDGNGRTGRYLLSLYLERSLSPVTVLSLSRTIAENKSAYYKAFDTVERPLNCCEATPFVEVLLGFLLQAQENIVADLEKKTAQLASLESALTHSEYSGRRLQALRYVAQMHLFEAFGETTLSGLTEFLGVSKATASNILQEFISLGVLEKTSTRPLVCKLSSAGAHSLGLDLG